MPLGEGNGTPLQYSCLENLMGGGAWWAAVHGVAKSQTWLSDFPFTFHFHALEKEMATHSSVLVWRIPGMGEPGWASVYGVAQSRTRLKRLSSSSSILPLPFLSPTWNHLFVTCICESTSFLLYSLVVFFQIRSDQSLSHVRLFATPWIAACQASLSITNSRSSLRLTSIKSVISYSICLSDSFHLS